MHDALPAFECADTNPDSFILRAGCKPWHFRMSNNKDSDQPSRAERIYPHRVNNFNLFARNSLFAFAAVLLACEREFGNAHIGNKPHGKPASSIANYLGQYP